MIGDGINNLAKRLFLICPTDGIEAPIRNNFIGSVYFYSALGAYFNFDAQTQNSIWQLINDKMIDQVVMVTAITNVFYQQTFSKDQFTNYPINRVLSKMNNTIDDGAMSMEAIFPNYHLLAAKYMKDQKKRLLSTSFLGNCLEKKNIPFYAYIFHPSDKVFSSLDETEKRGYLLNGILCN